MRGAGSSTPRPKAGWINRRGFSSQAPEDMSEPSVDIIAQRTCFAHITLSRAGEVGQGSGLRPRQGQEDLGKGGVRMPRTCVIQSGMAWRLLSSDRLYLR